VTEGPRIRLKHKGRYETQHWSCAGERGHFHLVLSRARLLRWRT
jgi:hypothetical protein